MGAVCLGHSWVCGTFLGFYGLGALELPPHPTSPLTVERSPGGCQHLPPCPDPLLPPGTCCL